MTTLLVLPALLLLSLLTWSRPQTAFVLLTGMLPTYLIRFSVFALPTNFFEAAVVVIFFSSLLNGAARRSWRIAHHHLSPYPRFFVGAFVLASIVSTATSPDILHSLGILKGWVIIPLMFCWTIFAWRHSLSVIYRKPKPLPGSGSSSLASIAPFVRSLVFSGNVMGLIGLAQINDQARITSFYDVPNSLALFLVPLLVISAWLSFVGWQRSFYFPSTVILAAAVVATQSAGGLAAAALAVILGLLTTLFYQSSVVSTRSVITRWILVSAFIIVSVAYLLSTGRLAYLSQPFLNPAAYNSVSVRQQLWSVSIDLVKENPILGVGLGTFELAYQQQLHERFSQFDQCQKTGLHCTAPLPEFVFRDPHNWFLSFWLNTGLLGLTSFILLNGYVFYATRRLLRPSNSSLALLLLSTKQKQSADTRLRQALVLALFSILIFGLVDTVYWKNDLSTLYWLIVFFII